MLQYGEWFFIYSHVWGRFTLILENMKIGLAIYNFNPRKGGAERYAYDLSLRLAQKGHAVFVFCAAGIDVPGVNLVRVDTANYPRWLRSLSFAVAHRRMVNNFGLDVTLGFGNTLAVDVYQSHGGIQPIWMAQEIASYDSPVERSFKAALLKTSINQKVQQWVSEYAIRQGKFKRIIAISEMIKKHTMEYYGLPGNKIDVVYNGVDMQRFHPAREAPRGPLKVLFGAGNFRLKGLTPLLLALGEVAKKGGDIQLLVMGRGRRKRYDKLIDALGIRERITFLGEQARPEDVYRQAHVLAHPTFYDACSLTTMEGMASGLPVITTAWNGASALVSREEGFVIDEPRNTGALEAALISLLDGDRRITMGRNARLKMEQYTMETNADRIESILRSVCDEKNNRL